MKLSTRRPLGFALVAALLLATPASGWAQSQASKTGVGLPRQTAGAASGQSARGVGTLSTGAVAAAIGLAVVIGIGVAIASSDGGGSSASSTN